MVSEQSDHTVTVIIRKYPLISFFTIAYIITWGLWIPFAPMAYSGRAIPISLPGVIFGIFGPAAAAIIVYAATNTKSVQPRSITPIIMFVLFWSITTFIHLLRRTDLNHITAMQLSINAVLGIPPAVVLAFAFSRIPAVREGLATLIHPCGAWYWYVAAALCFPALRILGLIIAPFLGENVSLDDMHIQHESVFSILMYIAYKCMHNIVAEESGWRGFALPYLQHRYGPLIATALLAIFWILWHIPLHMAEAGDDFFAVIWLVYIDIFWGAFLLTWIFNRTHGSILAAGIMHISFNFTYDYIPSSVTWHVLLAVVAFIIMIKWILQKRAVA